MLDRMNALYTVHRIAPQDSLPADLEGVADRIVAVATNGHDGVPDAVMDALPNLKIIACYGVGYDAIDAARAAARGIIVTHTPDVLNKEVANTAIMLMLAVSRRLVTLDAYVRSGAWAREGAAPLTRTIEGATVGILGMGRIGETIAKKLEAGFGASIEYCARTPKEHLGWTYHATPKDLAAAVDILVVITPGGPDTRHLVDRTVMDALGPEGMLVNVARGSVVDEEAMIAALTDGRLGSAGLDVFEAEPVVPPELCGLSNVVLTPHVGSATVETRQAMGDLVLDNLEAFAKTGRAVTPVPECKAL
ncbi:2-hydroxyacid dehydrogenase [Rhodobacteraceae bacterium KN286]|uniref:2-hydroxyacid dehydrogenase n=2 Tax=Oceanomicrobium pacificus TaxID=2692916 RepID=A0A6B0TYZ9_9RHOB|nr:2-hydroxyacid dehydrogenase [Oceanomicrobium pacificus]